MKKTVFVLALFLVQFGSVHDFPMSGFFSNSVLAMDREKKEEDIIKAAIKVIKNCQKADADITYLIEQYIDLNGSQEYIENYLKSVGCNVSVYQKKDDIVCVYGSYDIKEFISPLSFFCNYEIRFLFYFKDNKIVDSKCFMFTQCI